MRACGPRSRTGAASRRRLDCAGRARERESELVAAGCAPGKNCNGQRESDCLIKTELCDGRRPVLTQRDFCPVL